MIDCSIRSPSFVKYCQRRVKYERILILMKLSVKIQKQRTRAIDDVMEAGVRRVMMLLSV